MVKHLLSIAIVGLLALPLAAAAAQTANAGPTISAATLPDTTYRVVVDQVADATHIEVTMQNGVHTTLTAGRPTITFSAVHPGDTLMLSTSKGTVLVFKDYGVVPAVTPAP
ncbi:MAG TPA: hypothetical protein VIN40_08335 [Candidatus Tyrphobacter sp.]